MLRQQIQTRLQDITARVVRRLMRWADADLSTSTPSPATPSAAEPAEVTPVKEAIDETAVEAALEAALDLSQTLAEAPPNPPRSVHIYTDATPNPNAMKFSASVVIVDSGSISIASAADAQSNPMAKRLFTLEGVDSLFAVNDFCTVIKTTEANWSDLIGPIERILIDELSRS